VLRRWALAIFVPVLGVLLALLGAVAPAASAAVNSHNVAYVFDRLAVPLRIKRLSSQTSLAAREPTGTRFRITRADVGERIVWEIDGRPATEAYAEAVGVEVQELDSATFMRSPVGLMIDGEPWIRSPQQVIDGGGLKFYCQILEGIDVDLMHSTNLIAETRNALQQAVDELGTPAAGGVLFNCILRRLELDATSQQQAFGMLGQAMRDEPAPVSTTMTMAPTRWR